MQDEALFLGLDLGTSGARAVVIDAEGLAVASGSAAMADFGPDPRSPAVWWAAADHALRAALAGCDAKRVAAFALDGTSGTMLPVDNAGEPLSGGLMYNDACGDAGVLARIAETAPPTSAAHGSSSGLARAVLLARAVRPHLVLHQADWIAFHLSGRFVTDANNALKTGYDPVAGQWPDWIGDAGLEVRLLPRVVAPGTPVGPVTAKAAAEYGLRADALVVAGTTDGCASFLATGASEAGDGVTALGTTLTLKILSDRPIFAPQSGIYSHRILGKWLAGGASNTGGNVLLAHFTPDRIAELSARIDPAKDSGLDYYPLLRPGERFPVADPDLAPRLTPRPDDDAAFLHGLLDGIAGIEAMGYARLTELGAPPLARLRSVGGGAGNTVWSALRQRRLGVPFAAPDSMQAAYGTARLARAGAARA
jgi:sugar (pentulose or hexulose) kinase